ncbi:hypothetical protein R1T16_16465 [Flavobacterium sp. DG1-102-2]|uniref:hypothetical protein n=1 Tax=Flavobacterium sp. DG1-102-2 TaxID=3081663 RepID=UPI00294A1C80|nr:hypothetical protein [Flavobacterium sp. DG1-102-2]MDV6170033.1 hypothetical protein [Flavobacterium sp. DG1-102-2]
MQNKILAIIFAIAIMQLIYFLVKGMRDKLNGGNVFLKGREHLRAIIAIVLLAILVFFMLI